MDQATKSILLATATAEATAKIQSFMDFEGTKTEGRAFMEMAAEIIGLSKTEGRGAYDANFADFKQSLLEWAEKKAKLEIDDAVKQAEGECAFYIAKRDDLNRMLADQLAIIDVRKLKGEWSYSTGLWQESVANQLRTAHADLMKIVHEMHRESLRFAFIGHLISKETAEKLVDLYEVR